MTVLSPDEKQEMRNFLNEITADEILTSVKLLVEKDKLINKNPEYKANSKQNKDKIYPEIAGFRCRVYNLLSSKLQRLFRSTFITEITDAGIIDATVWLVEYTNGLYELLTGTGVATNILPSSTLLEDSTATFVSSGVRAGAKVLNLTDLSEGFVVAVLSETQLSITALDGGTINLFTGADQYEIWNKNYLREDDQFFISQTGKWGTVLNTVPDSEGLQIATLVKDV